MSTPSTLIAICTAGDKVRLPPITIAVLGGYSLEGARILFKAWAGPIGAPIWAIVKDSAATDPAPTGLAFNSATGVLDVTIVGADWPAAALAANERAAMEIEVEVTLAADDEGPHTVLSERYVRVKPQANRAPLPEPEPEPEPEP